MSLTTYCELDEVRSALGVNAIELKDSVLTLPVYEMGLVRELNRLSTSLNAAFSTVHTKAPGDRTTVEASFHDAVRLFSVYAVAKQVGVSLANFAPKDVGDGKSNTSRFAGDPFKDTLDRVEAYYSALRVEAKAAYEAVVGVGQQVQASLTPATTFIASKRSYDPVTGA